MLKPERARQQLAALAGPKHTQGRLNRLKKLPKALAEVGLNLLGRRPDGKPISDYGSREVAEGRATATLEAKTGDRAKVFAALFPTLAAEVEAGWQLFARLPYTVGYDRRSFRAPGRPAAYRTRRQGWIDSLFDALRTYPDDALSAEWIAAWAVHLDDRDSLGYLLAAAIDRGDDTVFEIVKDSAAGRHDVGGPGLHTTRALLSSAKPAAWEFAEKLLLAAQRQEGLRQNILEAVDEAHPEAFRRMLRLLLDQDLLRFSSVARAAGVWLGEEESALAPKKLKDDLTQLHTLLGDPKAREAAVVKGDALACYRGLWCLGFVDVDVAVARAVPILRDKAVGRRFAAGKLLASTGLPEVGKALLPLFDDPDSRLVGLALTYYEHPQAYGDDDPDAFGGRPKDLFERLEKLVPRLPENEVALKPVAEGWDGGKLSQETAADLLAEVLDKRPPERLLPYLPLMSEWPRVRAIAKLVEPRTLTAQVREMLLAVAGHPSGALREAALKGLQKCKIAEDEAQTLEGYLTRKNADLRRGLFDLLLNRTDKAALGSVDRLIAARDANQRLGGLEIARRLVEAERQTKAVRTSVAAFRDRPRKLSRPEAEAVEALLNPQARPATLDDCLGLVKPGERTAPTPPKKRRVKFASPAAVAFVRELDAFIHQHKDTTFTVENHDKSTVEVVLGSAYQWHFRQDADDEAKGKPFPLADLWETFWKARSPKARDGDGLELLRAVRLRLQEVREGEEDADPDDYEDEDEDADRKLSPAEVAARKELDPVPPVPVRYEQVIDMLLVRFVRQHPPAGAADFLLDAAETALALVPSDVVTAVVDPDDWRSNDWRDGGPFVRWLEIANAHSEHLDWTTAQEARLYRLLRWVDEPVPGVSRHRPEWQTTLAAYDAKAATVADFIDELIGPRGGGGWRGRDFNALGALTAAAERVKDTLTEAPELRAAVEKCVARVLDVELARGETPSAATGPAKSIGALFGRETLFRLLKALGKAEFTKTTYSVGDNKPTVLTHLVRNCHPLPTDTPEEFADHVKGAVANGDFPEGRTPELALLNPRWVTHVERAVGWPGFSEAVWWFIAHTSNSWDDSRESEPAGDGEEKPQNGWAEIVKARTNLTAEQRAEGVVDVAWFHTAYTAVGNDARWDAIEAAARFLGYGQGHKKAARLADVLLGRTKKKDLIDGIRQKNLKEYVRLLGLLPLPEKPAAREAELMDRHKVLKEYERYARGLSSMSREPALLAARLGLENLAVTANYPDPLRLEWAVGAKAVADLMRGPVTVSVKNVAVELSLGDLGIPDLTQTKDGKPIKALPPDVKQHAKVAELVERRNDLKRAAASTKRSLEQAMCQGDAFTADEVQQLMGHALVRPLLGRLVLAADGVRGYPVAGGLRDHAGTVKPIPAGATVLIAHPTDLLAAGDWPAWQAECFRVERLQPFKQVFREVYAVTAQERDDGTKSQRYAGQQLNPTQAMALFGTRGWSTKEGVEKLFREAGLTAEVRFDRGWTTPGEVEGLTIHNVQFHRRGDWKPVALTAVPVKVFSEVMRDLDLVVSVAHVGGVDPEASASTVEMRAMLLRETCALLKVANVKLDSRHALVRGTLGSYSVHLGSGVVHKQPGGALCIVPVHAQHRGRLFLPFADDDPRTAEVVSKVLLLARDQEIQDPTILAQIAGQ